MRALRHIVLLALFLPCPSPAVTELFPAQPAVDTQRGFAVAVDGDWLALGAPLAPLDDGTGRESGGVHLFHWSSGRWMLESTLRADPAQPGARFGSAVALRDGTLAVGALGEGTVYLFRENDGAWSLSARLRGRHGQFGRSVALGGGRLAVGEVAPRGEAPGAVSLYTAPSWTLEKTLTKETAPGRPGNRFGESVALDGGTLAVGDPADGESAGAVSLYRFDRGSRGWTAPPQVLTAPHPLAGSQLGAAVALDGNWLAVGAPTANFPWEGAGAVYTSRRETAGWSSLRRLARGRLAGDHLGAAVALDGGLLVAGAPAPVTADGRPGAARVFRVAAGVWTEAKAAPQPDNTEARDQTGFAVAVRGSRVAVAAVLGDQGGPAAGAAWTFTCPAQECGQEGETVVRDRATGQEVGVALASTADYLAIGASPGGAPSPGGAVSVYRRAGKGWRQEARLTTPSVDAGTGPPDGFGSAVALDGDTLAVGAPNAQVGPSSGAVYIFIRRSGSWEAQLPLFPQDPVGGGRFGSALALAAGTLVVGVPGGGVSGGLVVIYQRLGSDWTRRSQTSIVPLDALHGGEFGAALSLDGDTLVVGAPGNGLLGNDAGAAAVFTREAGVWSRRFAFLTAADVQPGDRFGSSVVVNGPTLAVGAPSAGTTYVFQHDPGGWSQAARLPSQGTSSPFGRFGAALSLAGGTLAVGAPGAGEEPGLVQRFTAPLWQPEGQPLTAPFPGGLFGAPLVLRGSGVLVGAPGGAGRIWLFESFPTGPELAASSGERP